MRSFKVDEFHGDDIAFEYDNANGCQTAKIPMQAVNKMRGAQSIPQDANAKLGPLEFRSLLRPKKRKPKQMRIRKPRTGIASASERIASPVHPSASSQRQRRAVEAVCSSVSTD